MKVPDSLIKTSYKEIESLIKKKNYSDAQKVTQIMLALLNPQSSTQESAIGFVVQTQPDLDAEGDDIEE